MMKSTIAVMAGLLLVTSASYAGVTINGTAITFNDATMQTTAKPSDHGGTSNTVNGTDSFIGGGYMNLITDNYGTIGGGFYNQAGDDAGGVTNAEFATVGGGDNNTASRVNSTVGGGDNNTASGYSSTVGGGYYNEASGDSSTVGGGLLNEASGSTSTVGGGKKNKAIGLLATTVGGGYYNEASGHFATVSGGLFNEASGDSSTVGGGDTNIASGNNSFVAGRLAKDLGNNNSFVWGGYLGLAGSPMNDRTSAGADTFNVWSAGGIFLNGSVEIASDRNKKEAFSFVSAREVLDKVVELPMTTWRFKSEDDSVRHIGPMAQDFMAAFGYGRDDRYITATDADGVALAAIQGLYAMQREELHEQAEVNTALRWHNEQLHQRNNALEARLARLEKAILRQQARAPGGHTD